MSALEDKINERWDRLNQESEQSDHPVESISLQALAAKIDHTALKPLIREQDIIQLCQEALEHQFASVCINSFWVPLCAKLITDPLVSVCTVVGFPLGANSTDVKAKETQWAADQGATEIDMVLNLGMLKSEKFDLVAKDISAVVEAAPFAKIKVIMETCQLTDREKCAACVCAQEAGAHFVKTSTGFSTKGATVSDVRLLRQAVGQDMGVKAAGGIRDYETALAMIRAGADRIGASASLTIIKAQSKTGEK
jgi:deoxyribose-phosphate aldolase